MGLQERRRIKMLQEELLPALKAEIREMAGAEIEWEVDWSGFHNMEALDNIEYQGLRRIHDALRAVCYDDLGKEAVRDGVKKIVVKNFDDLNQKKISFAGKILEVYGAWGLGWEGYPGESEIKTILENGL